MDQHAFVFVTRGHCIKGKQCQHIAIKNKICVCVQKNRAYFPFMHYPLVAKLKAWLSIGKTNALNCSGLVIMGGDSSPEGCGFELFVCQDKYKRKRGRGWPILKRCHSYCYQQGRYIIEVGTSRQVHHSEQQQAGVIN